MKKITIHIDDYTKKDGTEVSGYDRDVEVRDLTEEEIAQREEAKNNLADDNNQDNSEVPPQIEEIESEIRKDNFETAVIYDDDGNVLLRKKGRKNAVDITFADLLSLGGIQDKMLTHNHPIETSFSNADLQFFATYRPKVMRAVSKKREHTLKSTGVYMSTEQTRQLKKDYTKISRRTRVKLTHEYRMGRITKEEFSQNFDHTTMETLSKAYSKYFTYKRV